MPLKISLQNTDLFASPKQNKNTTKNESQKKRVPFGQLEMMEIKALMK